jgi:hypothetical protein
MIHASVVLLLLLPPLCLSAWVDPSTPPSQLTATSFLDSASYTLVMSDEFNTPGRSFSDGGDPTWTALDRHDDDISASGEGPLHFYNSSMVGTGGGWLNVSTGRGRTEWTEFDSVEQVYKVREERRAGRKAQGWGREGASGTRGSSPAFSNLHKHPPPAPPPPAQTKKKDFKSGMVNSWDKFCFTGGIVEISAVMPGSPTTAGLWPAMWLLGNLGRATYEASTNKIWPWSFDECDRELQVRLGSLARGALARAERARRRRPSVAGAGSGKGRRGETPRTPPAAGEVAACD